MLSDYHHFHFPCTCVPSQSKAINGKLFAGGSYNQKDESFFYAENYRTITKLKTKEFGNVLMCEIGAFTVGSIKQVYNPHEIHCSGAPKGYFEPGGSTVVLIFEKNRIRFDRDLTINSYKQIETTIQYGDRIGYRQSKRGI